MTKNILLLEALKRENTGRAPVWIMRQAGRYMPSYQKIREKTSLMEMFHNEELITQITLLPIKELGVDAAILFSDLLIPLQALGYTLSYEKMQGPCVEPKSLLSLQFPCPTTQELSYRFSFLIKSIQSLRKELQVPLIGFCGAPFTLASYVLENGSHHLMKNTKSYLYERPREFHDFLELLTQLMINYATLQVLAGAEVIQIFDSWAGVLDEEQFKACSTYYIAKILRALEPFNVPVIVFSRGSSYFVKELVEIAPSAISFDWHKPMSELIKQVPASIAVQGNLDPDFLRAPHEMIIKKTKELLSSMKEEKRFIINLGHGILPDISPSSVLCFVDTVKNFNECGH